MIALYLLAAHLVGDFVLQSRTMTARKLDEPLWRLAHVGAYLVPMSGVAAWAVWGDSWGDGLGRAYAFLVLVGGLHYVTDSRRFRSTIMDWIEWWIGQPKTEGMIVDYGRRKLWRRKPLEPNPWVPLPIVLDQTFHLCQIAVLGGIFLA